MTTGTYTQSYICIYVITLAFKVFQPIKRKYKLSFNLLLCLCSMYLYSILVDNTFSRSQIFKFITYFNYNIIKRYFDIFIERGLIIPCIKHGSRQYYKLSEECISIVKEIPTNYNKVLYEFSNKYNVSL